MPYTPDPADATQPTEDKFVETAAAEFRALKGRVNGLAAGTTDRAAIRAALCSSSATVDWIWNADVAGAANAGAASSIYLQRKADYTGGTVGNVHSLMYLETFTPTGTHGSFEWGFTSVLHSRSIVSGSGAGAAPQNVALNGTAFRTAGDAPIWAGNFAAYHMNGAYTGAQGPMHGVEINVGANGVDAGESTIGAFIVPQYRADQAGPGYFEGWTGILITGSGAESARFRNGITNRGGSVFGYFDGGTHQVAIDLSTSTNGIAALRIKANDYIDFEATSQKRMRYNSSTGYLEFYNGASRKGFINLSTGADVDLAAGGGSAPANMMTTDTAQTVTALKTYTGGIDANGIIVRNGIALDTAASIQWNSAATFLTAGSGFGNLPANPVGFVPILIDGVARKVPFYV